MYDDDYPTCRETFATLRVFVEPEKPNLLSSESHVASKDVRRHIDYVLDLIDRDSELRASIREHRSDITCFWASAQGHGGPTVSPQQMSRLASLGIDLWFDFYGE